ncbi:MAG TPA: XRE family transcriptional regulator [Gammaproteobacteria bacterium]|nr:XRE family transcriptional regulator [Gammaproteobacteria bacterium]
MTKESLPLSSSTLSVLKTLGAMIKAARLERGMSQAELSERLGVSRYTVIALEKGEPKVGVGTVFEAATVVGIPLLASDQHEFNKLATTVANLTSILPERGRRKKVTLDDDF